MSISRLSVNNPVVANLLMIAIIVLGLLSFVSIPREYMPDISFNWAFIITPYPGVTPEEIERLITVPIEDEIQDVPGIESIASASSEGTSFVSIKFQLMSEQEFKPVFQDLRAEVDKVRDLPQDAQEPIVMYFTLDDMMPLVMLHLHGDVPEKELGEMAEMLRDRVLDVSGVGKVELAGKRDRQILIEADPARLEALGLSPSHLKMAIEAQGVNVPAGHLSFGRKDVLLRTVGEYKSSTDVGNVIIRSTPNGGQLRVKDVSTITEDFEEATTESRLDGEPAITLTITKKRHASSIDVTDQVTKIAADFEASYGHRIRVTTTQDTAANIKAVMGRLGRNAWAGFLIVMGILFLVVGLRNAVLAAMGIPLSFLACFIFMDVTGRSFNTNALFGFVLVLGIIVDDAIIIVENCYRHRQQGKTWAQAAIDGSAEVMGAVFSATATTVAAFLPLMLIPGILGRFLSIIPIAVSLALVASLVEAFVILPSHFAEWPGKRIRQSREKPWLLKLKKIYETALRKVIKRRYLVVLGGLPALLAAVVMLVATGLIEVNLYKGEEVPAVQIRVTMPPGTNLATTSATIREFEAAARTLPEEERNAIHGTAGLLITEGEWIYRSDVGQIYVDLKRLENRERAMEDIVADLRRVTAAIPGPTEIQVLPYSTSPPLGKPVEVKVKGKHLDQLREVSDQLQAELSQIDGVVDIGDDFKQGKEEIRFTVIRQSAALHNLTAAQVGLALRTAIDGIEAGSIYDGDEEIEIIVRVDRGRITRPEQLLSIPLLMPTGQTIPLGNVVEYKLARGFTDIKRWNQQRAITVHAEVEAEKISGVEASRRLTESFDDLAKRYPGVSLDFSGEFKEFTDSFSAILQLMLFSMLLIYAILGTQFRSYVQPLVILLTVPFAVIGAVVALFVGNDPFSTITMFGIAGLAGVAVNDAIVLMTFINNEKAGGKPPIEAVVEASKERLRPIILTSATTMAGLIPLATGLGGRSDSWEPLANVMVWGLAVATIMTLFVIPATYMIVVEDWAGAFRKNKPEVDDNSTALDQ